MQVIKGSVKHRRNTEVLCTSLTDMVKFPIKEFGEFYHYRWHVDEACKLLKCKAELEAFSGNTATAVRQYF